MAMASRMGGWRAPTQTENPLGAPMKWGRGGPPSSPVGGGAFTSGGQTGAGTGMGTGGAGAFEMSPSMPWFSSGAAPAPQSASTSPASPAMAGLMSAMQPEPAAGMLAGGDRGLDPRTGQRTPPQAMRILSQLARVY